MGTHTREAHWAQRARRRNQHHLGGRRDDGWTRNWARMLVEHAAPTTDSSAWATGEAMMRLHLVGGARPLPVNAHGARPATRPSGPSPLGDLPRPVAAVDTGARVFARRLDRGRLTLDAAATATLAWPAGTALRPVIAPGLAMVELVPSSVVAAGSSVPHVNRRGQIVLTGGLRRLLGVENDGHVLAVLTPAHGEHAARLEVLSAATAAATFATAARPTARDTAAAADTGTAVTDTAASATPT